MTELEEKNFDNFLNALVIFGTSKTSDNLEFDRGWIVPLNENIIEPVKIIKKQQNY